MSKTELNLLCNRKINKEQQKATTSQQENKRNLSAKTTTIMRMLILRNNLIQAQLLLLEKQPRQMIKGKYKCRNHRISRTTNTINNNSNDINNYNTIKRRAIRMVWMVGIKREKISRDSLLEQIIPQTIPKLKAMRLILRFLAIHQNNKMLLSVEVFSLRS